MTLTLAPTQHAMQRCHERGIAIERAQQAVNSHSWSAPGNTSNSRRFVGDVPPPPVTVVTSWPPDAGGKVRLITAYVVDQG